jgi:hypothetical protein
LSLKTISRGGANPGSQEPGFLLSESSLAMGTFSSAILIFENLQAELLLLDLFSNTGKIHFL